MDITLVVIGLLAVASVLAIWGAVRWRNVMKAGGVTVALRWRLNTDDSAAGWHLGIGRYKGEEFAWFRVMSLRRGPDKVLNRDELHVAGRRQPSGQEQYALPSGATVLRFHRDAGSALEVAMASGTLTGFLSWLESAPPGHQIPRAS